MSDADYEFECSRAELLGIARPSRDEFLSRRQENCVTEEIVEDVPTEQLENLDLQGEGINRATGGLDELNNILSITQKKINKFKTVCGSFTNLLKLRVGKESEGDASSTNSFNMESEDSPQNQEQLNGAEASKTVTMTSNQSKDMNAQVGCQIDKLDSLIMKAERAEMSLHSQNKQMKSYLNK